MRGEVTPVVLLDAARSLDAVREPNEADAERARMLLLTLDRAATQGALLPGCTGAYVLHACCIPLLWCQPFVPNPEGW